MKRCTTRIFFILFILVAALKGGQTFALIKKPNVLSEIKQQLGVVRYLKGEVQLTEQLASQIKARYINQQWHIESVKRALSRIQILEKKLLKIWRQFHQVYQIESYDGMWQARILMNLKQRRSSARRQWGLQQVLNQVLQNLIQTKTEQRQLEISLQNRHQYLVFFHEQQYSINRKITEIKARLDLQKLAMSAIQVPKKTSAKLNKKWIRAIRSLPKITRRLLAIEKGEQSVANQSGALQTHFYLPVMAHSFDPKFIVSESPSSVIFQVQAEEPVAAVMGGTIEYINKGEVGLEFALKSNNEMRVIYRGIAKMHRAVGDSVQAQEVIAHTTKLGERLYLRLDRSGADTEVALSAHSFLGF